MLRKLEVSECGRGSVHHIPLSTTELVNWVTSRGVVAPCDRGSSGVPATIVVLKQWPSDGPWVEASSTGSAIRTHHHLYILQRAA